MSLPEIASVELRAVIRFADTLAPERLWPELIRGVWLAALRNRLCAWDVQRACADCGLAADCSWRLHWDRPASVAQHARDGYRVLAPWDRQPRRQVAVALQCVGTDAAIFARFEDLYHSLTAALRRGVGPRRVPGRLVLVEQRRSWLCAPQVDISANSEITVRFATPTVIQARGRLMRRFDPLDFTIAVLRRLRRFGASWPGESWRRLHDAALSVRIIADDIRTVSWRRYSARAGATRRQTGIQGGSCLYVPESASPLVPLWRLASATGLGRHTTVGCGQVEVRSTEVASSAGHFAEFNAERVGRN